MTSKSKIAIICALVIGLAGVGVSWMMAARRWSGVTKLTYSQFLEQVRAEQVASVIVFGSSSGATQATGRLVDGKTVRTVLPSNYRDALAAMQDKRVNVEIEDASSEPLRLFINATPFLLLLSLWILLMLRKFPNSPWRGNLG